MCICASKYVCILTHMHVFSWGTYAYIQMYAYQHTCICMHTITYAYVCILTHMHTFSWDTYAYIRSRKPVYFAVMRKQPTYTPIRIQPTHIHEEPTYTPIRIQSTRIHTHTHIYTHTYTTYIHTHSYARNLHTHSYVYNLHTYILIRKQLTYALIHKHTYMLSHTSFPGDFAGFQAQGTRQKSGTP